MAIDNAKRRFDVDLNSEIKRIKNDMKLKENGYPEFWGVVKKDFNKKLINPKLECPMNYLSKVEFKNERSSESTLPMSYFFVKFEPDKNDLKRRNKKVEEIIEKFSFNLHESDINEKEEYLLLRQDFDDIVEEIQSIYISKKYLGLFSWLLNRAFCIGHGVKRNYSKEKSKIISSNKSILLKILYDVNKQSLLKCFSNNIKTDEK